MSRGAPPARRWLRVACWASAASLLAGCAVGPTGVTDAGEAPTGVAAGPTLYFVDAAGDLVPERREVGRLGTVAEAVGLLLLGPGPDSDGELRSDLVRTDVTRVQVTATAGEIVLRLPLAADEAPGRGADQLVCTAVAAHVQAGGSPDVAVRLDFTLPAPGSYDARTCPVLG